MEYISSYQKVSICLCSHGPTSEDLCLASETDNRCGVTLGTTDETLDIRLNKTYEIS